MRSIFAFLVALALHVLVLRWAPVSQAATVASRVQMSVRITQPAEPPRPKAPSASARPMRFAEKRAPQKHVPQVAAAEPAATPVLAAVEANPEAATVAQGSGTSTVAESAGAPIGGDADAKRGGGTGSDAGDAESEASIGEYSGSVHGRVASMKRYPLQARKMHIEGITKVKFRLRKDGSLECPPEVITSSHPLLDQEALRMVQAAAPFAPLPKSAGDSREFTVSINFALNG